MDTAEIVRRLLTRPVTPERALKVLHLLERPSQLRDVLDALPEEAHQMYASVIRDALTDSVVTAHFARRAR